MLKTKTIIAIIIILIITALGSVLFFSYKNKTKKVVPKYTGPVLSLRVSTLAEQTALISIAKNQGFFKENGLDVSTKEYNLGASAIAGLYNNEVDIAVAAEFVGVLNSFSSNDLSIIASILSNSNAFKIIAIKDRGISKISDLKGKKIGVTFKTIGEYFLGTFLFSNNISLKEIKETNITNPLNFEDSLNSGSVDAVITLDPYAYNIESDMSGKVIIFPAQSYQSVYRLVFAKKAFVKDNPEAVRRFLKSIIEAKQFIDSNPETVKNLLINQFHYTENYISEILPSINFTVSLDQELLLQMENEARWLMKTNLVSSEKIPNYLDYFDVGPLKEIDPNSVSIIK